MPRIDSEFVYHPSPEQAGLPTLPYQNFLAAVFIGEVADFRISVERQPEALQVINETLQTLEGRESRVLQLRFGLADGKKRTLDETKGEFGLSRERIRQIERKALRKLRHPGCWRKLNEILPISEDSFAKSIFPEAELIKDIPQSLAVPLQDISWSAETVTRFAELLGERWEYQSLRLMLQGFVDLSGFSSEALAEIERVAKKIVENDAKKEF